MKVQRVRIPKSEKVTWIVLGDDYLPIEPIREYLAYLESIERSPNTIRSYAHHLSLYWEYLETYDLDWTQVSVIELAEFMAWLRSPNPQKIASMQEVVAKRTESTVNVILTSVCMLYDFHEKTGKVPHIPLYRSQVMPGRKYKSFLHHITKSKSTRTRLLKLKEPKHYPETLSSEQVKQLIDNCKRIRDKFLICLLHESGMRIGQALGLRHEDIQSWDNLIKVIPRDDNANGARAKGNSPYNVDVTKELMGLYSQYLQDEFMEILGDDLSDYVFVNLWDGEIGSAMTYNNVMDLFNRLKRKTGIAAHPHMLRHTHATELVREGVGMAYVQKRLNHASIQTTIDTYVHVNNEDMKREYNQYLNNRYDAESASSSEAE
ncbi:tyrosine-type recombinase/integrase [Nostoc sp. 'Peltigera membranacea cyanobiont' 232]|uniref:tyrosine-type recombinase/integrase n=1 Tax=Nostoc sp. 'Peltigera membranacea cyanobiont' 232 TaxID=2014531 RepID=UPI000B954983|nr:tyrosine-type recombinase/integrase [Nostoc sp. 'Peltigera membranacea cyanobiont' 232]OYE03566.1 transposase [Nostoc sp. 'Peltigera membranacea cyanobiont' 232]